MRQEKNDTLQFIAVASAACIVFAVMQGVHDNYGIMMKALVKSSGISYEKISFIIGVGAVLYGLVQALWGMAAVRLSNGRIMMTGAILIAVGLIVTPFCHDFATMLILFGVILPVGTGALGSGIIMGAITPVIGVRRAAAFTGVLQASAGIGDAIMSPALQGLIGWKNVSVGMGSFGVLMLATVPVIIWIGGKVNDAEYDADEQEHGDITIRHMISGAFRNPQYRRIFTGFSTCGFNMSIIESHLFSQYVSWGIPETASSFIMTIYGILTMLGALLTGFLITKFKMKNVLGSVYGCRVVISILMLVLPGSYALAIVSTAMLGMTGDSTVPPTMGIITKHFGAKQLAVLYGIALTGHQVGAFFSSWFGGICYTWFGNYDLLWTANMALATIAAIASYSIKETRQV